MGRHYITGKFKGVRGGGAALHYRKVQRGEGGWGGITLPESSKGVRWGVGRHYITGKFNKPQWILKNLIEPSHLQLSQSLTTAETQPSVLVKVTTL